ncbi:MAG: hypothetical protein J2P48_03115 [Alphaproteobacteria bacterium]|nr:hypothetical protein [Alphaproteobacteria bacterium]
MRSLAPVAALAAAAAIAAPLPAAARQGNSPWLLPPRPADSGKAIIYDPEFVVKGDDDRRSGCTPGLQCRFRLLGVIQNNGAVELRATAFTW